MWRTLLRALAPMIAAGGLAGCATGPLLDNPLRVRVESNTPSGTPAYLPHGPQAYDRVFTKVLDVLSDYWELGYQNRYDGRIETKTRIAPGIEQPWRPGSPDLYQRTLAFFQTIRDRCVVIITLADDGGYFVDVKVYKDLEDLPEPARNTTGAATFRMEDTLARQFEVVEDPQLEFSWIPIGRDRKLEQVLLQRIASMD